MNNRKYTRRAWLRLNHFFVGHQHALVFLALLGAMTVGASYAKFQLVTGVW